MANICESAQGSSRGASQTGLMGSNQKVRWQETRSNGRVSRLLSTRSTSWCLRSRTPKAELGNPVYSPRSGARSSLPAGSRRLVGQDRSGRRSRGLSPPGTRLAESGDSGVFRGKSIARATHGYAGQDAGRSECWSVVDQIRVRNLPGAPQPGAKASLRPAGVSLRESLENRLEGERRKKARRDPRPARPRSPESGDLSAANHDRKGCSDSVIFERAEKSNRVSLSLAFEMLEPGAVKVARRVLRGAGAGNGPVPTRRCIRI